MKPQVVSGILIALFSLNAFAVPKVEMTNPRYVEKQKKVDEQIKKDPRYQLRPGKEKPTTPATQPSAPGNKPINTNAIPK